jgi:hypothetical protein
MLGYRCVPAAILSLSLMLCHVPTVLAGCSPLGILTLASHAHLDESVASPGLSVFDGERLSTDAEGQLGACAGRSTIALAAKTDVTLFRTVPAEEYTLIWMPAPFIFRFQTMPLKCMSKRPS